LADAAGECNAVVRDGNLARFAASGSSDLASVSWFALSGRLKIFLKLGLFCKTAHKLLSIYLCRMPEFTASAFCGFLWIL
jgi:hypothetical protein